MNERVDEFGALMARAGRDDNQALARLIGLYDSEIQRAAQFLLRKALRSALDPTDLVQSVHLQLILGLKQNNLAIDSPDQLRSLAVTVLRHKFIQHWRRHRCQARHYSALATTKSPTEGKIATAIREFEPARAAEYNDLLDHLCRQLRVDERLLVAMRLQGYRTGEIAAELGIDPAALRVRLSRLRKRLRQENPFTEWI